MPTHSAHAHRRRSLPVWAVLWAVLVAAGLWLRPLMPVDETRYLAVAWEMWRDGNFLVPHLNGEAYSHKPPLLFWLMHLGWAVFGVSETWARMIAPLFGLASLALTAAIARTLWPGETGIARTAPLILIGMVFFALFTTLTMFDMLVTAFSLLGLLGILWAARAQTAGRFVLGFGLLALAIGLGVLAKGPAILLHTLPVALLAPWWIARDDGRLSPPGGWLAWHGGILAALLVGAAIALAWALPAAEAGGEAYRDAIFWGQSAGRITNSFAHQRAWWWYLAILPALLLPWTVWPKVWRGAWRACRDRGILAARAHRFLISWIVPAVVVFSAISGKQPHYLLPELAAFALLIAAFVKRAPDAADATGRFDLALPGGVIAAIGLIGLIAPLTPFAARIPDAVAPVWFALPLAAGAGVIVLSLRAPNLCSGARAGLLAGLGATLIIGLHLAARAELDRAFDTAPMARHLAGLTAQGVPIAHYGKYHGQFHFAGRYPSDFEITVEGPEDAAAWARKNPDGWLIVYRDEVPTDVPEDRVWAFRGKSAVLLAAPEILADPRRVLP